MTNADVLDHLLEIEAEAAALVNDANAEAEKRIAEAEKQNRTACETQYHNGAAAREEEFRQKTDALRETCSRKLAAFRGEIDSIKADTDSFSAVLDELFFGAE